MKSDVYQRSGRDPHDVLGVPEGADRQQVMRAFHRKARRGGHPDTGGDAQTFEEIIRARDVLLEQAQADPRSYRYGRSAHVRPMPNSTPRPAAGSPRTAAAPPRTAPGQSSSAAGPTRPVPSPPKETSGLAVVTVALALLGPLLWPVAIFVGHLALRQIKQTGKGGGSLVTVVLFFLYVITLPVLLRIASIIFIP